MFSGFYRTSPTSGRTVTLFEYIIDCFLAGGSTTEAERVFPSLVISRRQFPEKENKQINLDAAGRRCTEAMLNQCFKTVEVSDAFTLQFLNQFMTAVAHLRPYKSTAGQARLRDPDHKEVDFLRLSMTLGCGLPTFRLYTQINIFIIPRRSATFPINTSIASDRVQMAIGSDIPLANALRMPGPCFLTIRFGRLCASKMFPKELCFGSNKSKLYDQIIAPAEASRRIAKPSNELSFAGTADGTALLKIARPVRKEPMVHFLLATTLRNSGRVQPWNISPAVEISIRLHG